MSSNFSGWQMLDNYEMQIPQSTEERAATEI